MANRLRSVFTDDLNKCFITGNPHCHVHHIFYGSRRKLSELYGYIVPLAYYLHENEPDSVHGNPNHGLDLHLKQMAQEHFEEHVGSRDLFREIFGKSWL